MWVRHGRGSAARGQDEGRSTGLVSNPRLAAREGQAIAPGLHLQRTWQKVSAVPTPKRAGTKRGIPPRNGWPRRGRRPPGAAQRRPTCCTGGRKKGGAGGKSEKAPVVFSFVRINLLFIFLLLLIFLILFIFLFCRCLPFFSLVERGGGEKSEQRRGGFFLFCFVNRHFAVASTPFSSGGGGV